MKKIAVIALALAIATPAVAQDAIMRLNGETAMEMATRVNVCGGAGVASAEFVENGTTRLQVQCARGATTAGGGVAGMAGGLGAGGAAAVAGVVLALAVAGSSSTSGTN